MGLIYAKSLKHAKRKVADFKGLTLKESKRYVVKKSGLKSEEKGYKLYKVTKRR